VYFLPVVCFEFRVVKKPKRQKPPQRWDTGNRKHELAEHSQVLAHILNRARRRHLAQVLADESGLALTVALGGAVILLLIGTQILAWYWLVLLFGGSLAIGLWRTNRHFPSRYALAQRIDHRLGLADAISTAINYGSGDRKGSSAEVLEAQRAQAERTSRSVDLRLAFPFAFPRYLYAAGGVALVAFGMFALRYGVTRSMDLRPSLVKIAFDSFFKPDAETADGKKNSWRKKLEEELKKLGINMNATDAKQDQLDPASDVALNAMDSPDPSNSGESDTARSKAQAAGNEKESSEAGGDENSERASASGSEKGADQTPEGNDGQPQNGQKSSTPKGGKESNGQNSSLMDKMRDAMSSMMDKLKMNSKQGESKQSAQNSQQGSQSQQGKSDKSQANGKQQSSGSESQDQQSQQAQGDQSQAKGKSGDKNADQSAQDAKSGIGKQDGDKSAKEAEQLAAMGKISEILGKRAKDMSGEVMVEVSSGKQQLKTQYSSKTAAHAEAGGEISRDEVPMEYQSYVQQYFEQIRKLPAASAKKAGDASAPVPPAK